ncbi:MAG: restriction endonuclease [Deltaproteobacteria bacterium]|jgi:restriction system protein|nr:restriction endonuclease [Deltaproteobacteria bacterium]
MPLPRPQDITLPVLELCGAVPKASLEMLEKHVVKTFSLTKHDIKERLGVRRQTRLQENIGWACSQMAGAELLEPAVSASGEEEFRITSDGLKALDLGAEQISTQFMSGYQAYRTFRSIPLWPPHNMKAEVKRILDLDAVGAASRARALEDLRSLAGGLGPDGFGRLVIKLAIALGYGDDRLAEENASRVTEGTVLRHRLGACPVYVKAFPGGGKEIQEQQCKPVEAQVDAQGAAMGLIVAAGTFSRKAIYSSRKPPKETRLVDGDRLSRLLYRYSIGTLTRKTFEFKRERDDFFSNLTLK